MFKIAFWYQKYALLQDALFVMVSRNAHSFPDQARWLYAFSCDPGMQTVIRCLAGEIQEDYHSKSNHKC